MSDERKEKPRMRWEMRDGSVSLCREGETLSIEVPAAEDCVPADGDDDLGWFADFRVSGAVTLSANEAIELGHMLVVQGRSAISDWRAYDDATNPMTWMWRAIEAEQSLMATPEESEIDRLGAELIARDREVHLLKNQLETVKATLKNLDQWELVPKPFEKPEESEDVKLADEWWRLVLSRRDR